MSEPRVIKKYPNRRLYDTVESRYITLADIRRLVVDRIEFLVIDKKSQEDITRTILLQVIAEQEHSGAPVMSQDFLSLVIRSYGGSMHAAVGSYLEQSLKMFTTQFKDGGSAELADSVNELVQRHNTRWRQVQDEIFRTLTNATNGRHDDDESRDPATSHQR